MNPLQYIPDVATLVLNTDLCIGCGVCEIVCPHGVFLLEDKKALIVNKDSCMECGACQLNCPQQAIEVERGVGCAAAIIWGALTGRKASCG